MKTEKYLYLVTLKLLQFLKRGYNSMEKIANRALFYNGKNQIGALYSNQLWKTDSLSTGT